MRWVVGVLVTSVLITSGIASVRTPVRLDSTRWGFVWARSTPALFREKPPAPGVRLLDEHIYLGTMQRLAAGEGYYAAHHAMLQQNPGRWDTRSPLTYRQPLLTFLWALLGSGGIIGFVWALIAALSVGAAYVVSERLMNGGWPALLAPGGLALVYVSLLLRPPRILYSEMWAGPMIVLSVALCALVLVSRELPRSRVWVLSYIGAALALVAMLFRELALPFVVVMAFALFIDKRTRANSFWAPWAAAIVVWIGSYGVHMSRVTAIARNDPRYNVSQGDLLASYFHPGLKFLAACVRWIGGNAVILLVVAALGILALIGAARLRERALLTLVGGVTFGSLAALTLTGTFGTFADGNYTGYWGYLFVPPVLAWAPLGLHRADAHVAGDSR
jgi:hypothetical protein